MLSNRRTFLKSLGLLIAAIVRVSSLMPVKSFVEDAAFEWSPYAWGYPITCTGYETIWRDGVVETAGPIVRTLFFPTDLVEA